MCLRIFSQNHASVQETAKFNKKYFFICLVIHIIEKKRIGLLEEDVTEISKIMNCMLRANREQLFAIFQTAGTRALSNMTR